jgi:hypothetical protein
MIANRVSGNATLVVEAKMRMCVVRASSSPPPNAGAASAEIVGMGSCAIEARVPLSDVRKFAVLQAAVSPALHAQFAANLLLLCKRSSLF